MEEDNQIAESSLMNCCSSLPPFLFPPRGQRLNELLPPRGKAGMGVNDKKGEVWGWGVLKKLYLNNY
jgi:hypothetical protein